MKKLFLAVSFGLILGSASAQFVPALEIPSTVLKEFNAQYPHAKKVAWTKVDAIYQASFDTRNKRCFVEFDRSGAAVGQSVEIDKVKLPRGIRKKLERNYGAFIVEAAYMIDSSNESTYEAEIARSEEGYKLLFTAEGNLLEIRATDGSLVRR